jgi:hypothetical protein
MFIFKTGLLGFRMKSKFFASEELTQLIYNSLALNNWVWERYLHSLSLITFSHHS